MTPPPHTTEEHTPPSFKVHVCAASGRETLEVCGWMTPVTTDALSLRIPWKQLLNCLSKHRHIRFIELVLCYELEEGRVSVLLSLSLSLTNTHTHTHTHTNTHTHISLKVDARCHGDQSLFLGEEAEALRWFLLPSEARLYISGSSHSPPPILPPFQPKRYGTSRTKNVVSQAGMRTGDLVHGMETGQSRPTENSVEGTGLNSAAETGGGGEEEGEEEEESEWTLDQNERDLQPIPVSDGGLEWKPKFHHPPKNILKLTIEVSMETLPVGDELYKCPPPPPPRPSRSTT